MISASFLTQRGYTWNDVDRGFVTKFLAFMEKGDYMVSAQNKYLVDLRAPCQLSLFEWLASQRLCHAVFLKKES